MKNIIKLFFIVFVLSACTEVVDIELKNGGKRLVVEALIDWEKGTKGNEQTILLTYSSSFHELNNIEPATGATVKVINLDNGQTAHFLEKEDGIYITEEFNPIIGNSYQLEIEHDGNKYIATESMQSVSEITNIEQKIQSGFGEDETVISVEVTDPVGKGNYYHCVFSPKDLPIEQDISDDQISDGKEIIFEFENDVLQTGEVIDIKLYGISKNYYNFMNILIQQSGGDGGPFSTVPVPLKGNCKSINNPDQEVLGYFRLSQVIYTSHQIEE